MTPESLAAQERRFADAFAAKDLRIVRPLYDPAVVYVSPTVRLFDWPATIDGIDRTIEFIGLTIRNVENIRYQAVETAIAPAGDVAFVRIHFDWTAGARRLRSNYVVIYRYREGRIARQELYYDPSGRLEELPGSFGNAPDVSTMRPTILIDRARSGCAASPLRAGRPAPSARSG